MKSLLLAITLTTASIAAPVSLFDEAPVSITQVEPGVVLIDFGRVSFGNIYLIPPAGADNTVSVHFGEDSKNGRINREPPGSVRYAKTKLRLKGAKPLRAAPLADKRNTTTDRKGTPPAVLTPKEWGVILPFRWIEVEGWPGNFTADHIVRKSAFASNWDDNAASFKSSDEMLNRIWETCRYSIKATTFAGVYVDGDRERIPYEADAYLNQLSHYATDHDVQMARDTFDHLMRQPTWPTEWSFHMIFMAHADYLHTADTAWLAARYESLKPKLLLERVGKEGLLVSGQAQIEKFDIVDWPVKERDGFVFTHINTVVNAFYIRSLRMMSELATALEKHTEADRFQTMADTAYSSFQYLLYDHTRGAYRDGVGTEHSSQHASLFPLAFDLVPDQYVPEVVNTVQKRGMACSVYVAQYLLDALFSNGASTRALELMTAPNDRSWRHMVESGTTITWEAWDQKYKPNQDWNHAWGAAPANLLPRFVLGVEPITAGWARTRICPQTGNLLFAEGKIPTPAGAITVSWKNGTTFEMDLNLPHSMSAKLELPASQHSTGVIINGLPTTATRSETFWTVDRDVTGNNKIVVK